MHPFPFGHVNVYVNINKNNHFGSPFDCIHCDQMHTVDGGGGGVNTYTYFMKKWSFLYGIVCVYICH